MDGNAVRAFADAKDGEKNDLFELSEHGPYMTDNVENMVACGITPTGLDESELTGTSFPMTGSGRMLAP